MAGRAAYVGSGLSRRAAALAAAVLAAVIGAVLPASASATTETFSFTGTEQTWTVPAGITSAVFDLYGAQGGTAISGYGVGGAGGRATATLPLTPGEDLEIRVGGMGVPGGGYNGGGAGGSPSYPGGGGGTDVRQGGTSLTDRVLVAGGGGGSGGCLSGGGITADGGDGGGLTGGNATPDVDDGNCGSATNTGKGGTQSAGGTGGTGAEDGSLGQGGAGVQSGGFFRGGGGGGYYGGGGGAGSSGGGGGSGYGPGGTTFETGVRTGDGVVTIVYDSRLDVATDGSGAGTVTSTPAGIDCETGSGAHADCSALYSDGTEVALSADPDPDSTFAGWTGGGCSGAGDCTVTMDQARSVTATFDLTPVLDVSLSGDGSGTVTSNPAGIDCSSAGAPGCTAAFADGTAVTLTAAPDSDSSFAGWTGAGCSGTGACTATMDQARSVDAAFTKNVDPPPVIENLRVTPKKFRISKKKTAITSVKKGAKIKLTLSEHARVKFRIRYRKPKGNGNAPPPPSTRPKAFKRKLGPGRNKVGFTGTLRKRMFPPGRYRVIARARDSAGQKSDKVQANFRIVD